MAEDETGGSEAEPAFDPVCGVCVLLAMHDETMAILQAYFMGLLQDGEPAMLMCLRHGAIAIAWWEKLGLAPPAFGAKGDAS